MVDLLVKGSYYSKDKLVAHWFNDCGESFSVVNSFFLLISVITPLGRPGIPITPEAPKGLDTPERQEDATENQAVLEQFGDTESIRKSR